jgi:hypothetical protein
VGGRTDIAAVKKMDEAVNAAIESGNTYQTSLAYGIPNTTLARNVAKVKSLTPVVPRGPKALLDPLAIETAKKEVESRNVTGNSVKASQFLSSYLNVS